MIGFDHEAINHPVGAYVRMAYTQGIESFWSMLRWSHKTSAKHLQRNVQEVEGRHSDRTADTNDQMAGVAIRKRLRYMNPMVDDGLPSGPKSAVGGI